MACGFTQAATKWRAELVAACDPDPKCRAWAEQTLAPYGTVIYEDFDTMLQQESIEAVVIATITTAHAEQAIKAIQAEKHVLCEKPLATSLRDCLSIYRAFVPEGKEAMVRHLVLGLNHVDRDLLVFDGLVGDSGRHNLPHEERDHGLAQFLHKDLERCEARSLIKLGVKVCGKRMNYHANCQVGLEKQRLEEEVNLQEVEEL